MILLCSGSAYPLKLVHLHRFSSTTTNWVLKHMLVHIGRNIGQLFSCQYSALWLEGKENSHPAFSCSVEIKDSKCFYLCLSLPLYIWELHQGAVDNATTIRLATVCSVFSFQSCHGGKTMQHTCRVHWELLLFYCQHSTLGLRLLLTPLDTPLNCTEKIRQEDTYSVLARVMEVLLV